MVIGNMFLKLYGYKRQDRAFVICSSLYNCCEEILKIFQCRYATHLTRLDKRVVDYRHFSACMTAKSQQGKKL